jgi:hypothetical protein
MLEEDMTPEEIIEFAAECWRANKKTAAVVAETVMKRNNLPLAAPVLVQGLAKLLADLQQASFCHGVAAALVSAKAGDDPQVN